VTHRRNSVTDRRDIASRARTPLRGMSRLSRVTDAGVTEVVGRDSDRAPLRSDPVPITPGTAQGIEEKTRAHKAKLAQDPRFAGWLGLMAADDPDPSIGEAAQRRAEERLELTRRAKYSFLLWAQDNPETDPAAIAEARQFLADHPPLQRALGTGEPA